MTHLRHAVRRLLAAPGFTAFAVLTLAIGIGATTAIYSVTYAVLFRPLDIRNLHEVVNVYHSNPRMGGPGHYIALSWPDIEQIRARQDVFAETVAWTRFMPSTVQDGEVRRSIGEIVEGHYFAFVGATALLGRPLQARDDAPDAPAVVVISEPVWRRDFAADPAVVGQTLPLEGLTLEIVGVMPAAFRGVDMPNIMPTEYWVPLGQRDRLFGEAEINDAWRDPEERWLMFKGRLAEGRSVEDARSAMRAIGDALDVAMPIGSDDRRATGSPTSVRRYAVIPAADLHAHESVDAYAVPVGTAVLVAVGLVLLVACTNLANLLLARGARRSHEVAVRRALGASRSRVVAELATDSLLLGVLGGVAGLLLSLWLMVQLSGTITLAGIDIHVRPGLEPAVLLAALASVGVSILVFGIVPAWHATRAGLRSVLDQESGGAVARWRGRRLLIVAQVAVSVALLVAGSVFLRQMWVKSTRDPGFDLDRLAAVQIDFRYGELDPARAVAVLDAALEAVRRDPGVASAALATRLPIHIGGNTIQHYAGTEPTEVTSSNAGTAFREGRVLTGLHGSASLFEVLGLRLIAGRAFSEAEAAAGAPVVVLSRTAAQRVFGSTDVTGRTVFLRTEPREVVGVVEDVDYQDLGNRTFPWLFAPAAPDPEESNVLVVRARRDPAAVLAATRATLRRIEPLLPVVDTATGPEIIQREMLVEQIGSRVVAVLGAFAMLLALAGLYGLLSYLVAGRRRELGLRIALGADRGRLVRMVIGSGLRPVLLGVVVGLLGGAGLASFVGSFLYRGAPFDWLGLVAVPLVLVPAAAAACYLPARRAAGVDPIAVLRDQ
jgi:predicted permease